MGVKKRSITIIIFTLLIIITILPGNTYAMKDKKVLFITANSYYTSKSDNKISGVKDGLEDNVDLHITYFNEVLTEEGKEKEYYYNDIRSMTEKYNYDAIITGDSFTLEFALRHRDDIFKSIPIVFFGVFSDNIIEKALSYEDVVGLKQVYSISSTIDLILKYHPHVDNIVLINDSEEIGDIKKFKEEVVKKYDNISFETIFTNEITQDELKDKLSHYDRKDAIITMNPNEFANYNWLNNREVNEIICNSIKNVPLYNLVRDGIGYGSIGGKVISAYNQGKKAGEIASDIINGKEVNKLYNSDEEANQYVFDYIQLLKYGIRTRNLPKGSSIVNSPVDVIKLYKEVFIFIFLFIIFLITTIICMIRYLRYKKKHEESLQKAIKESEEINKLKNYFIVNMNHELKTPITVINSVMQLTKHKRKLNNNYIISLKHIKLVEENCQRLLRLVNNIIDLEKIDSNCSYLYFKNVNIVEIIEDTVLSVVPFAQSKNVEIVFDTNQEEIIMAVDKTKIERIVLNLLSNAIKYSKEAGFVDVKINTNFKVMTLIVEDDGIGIDEKYLDTIFDRFVQINSSFNRQSEGSGIGLSIVKSFVECHNGTIKVESTLHKGTKFTIDIPINIIDEDNMENNPEIIDMSSNIKQELADIYI